MSSHSLSTERILEKALESEMISAEQLHLLIQTPPPDLLWLDVRTPSEHRQGVIPGSVLFPCDHNLQNLEDTSVFISSFGKKFRPELFDNGKKYVLICRTGPRTAIALEMFLRHGLAACELLGGITEWRRQGLAVESPGLGGG
ncbi:MAG: hypothetical protein HQL80_08130 [Magnetococcales bacterium]|nr:hypothetical protein [Magnetococcales bacterium]